LFPLFFGAWRGRDERATGLFTASPATLKPARFGLSVAIPGPGQRRNFKDQAAFSREMQLHTLDAVSNPNETASYHIGDLPGKRFVFTERC